MAERASDKALGNPLSRNVDFVAMFDLDSGLVHFSADDTCTHRAQSPVRTGDPDIVGFIFVGCETENIVRLPISRAAEGWGWEATVNLSTLPHLPTRLGPSCPPRLG